MRPSAVRATQIVEGDYAFTNEDFTRVAAILHAEAGIALSRGKATLVYSRLAKRLRALQISTFTQYCDFVEGEGAGDERQGMIAALTTNVTRFFREPHHFEHLQSKVLPELMDRARRGGRIRLWSAGCSSGQEPYSLAMTLLTKMPDASKHDVRILATDIDPNMVAAGRAGFYRNDHLADVPKDLLRRFFEMSDRGQSRVSDQLRELVSFRELNLIGDWPMKGAFQAIFCRNVVIYFDDATQARIWPRFASHLEAPAYLYIGHSERLNGAAASRFDPDGITTYRLGGRKIAG